MKLVQTCLPLIFMMACAAGVTGTGNTTSSTGDKQYTVYSLPKVGLKLELDRRFRVVSTENVDSLVTLLQGLRQLINPCTGTLTSLERLASNESMELLIDTSSPSYSIFVGALPQSNLSPNQSRVLVQNLCGRMYRGLSMQFVSDSTGTSRLGPFYTAKFVIGGDYGTYSTTLFIVTSPMRTYTFAFNGPVVKDPIAVIQSAKESAQSISLQSMASFIQLVNPGYDKQLMDTAASYLYASLTDTLFSTPGVKTMPACCSFYLQPELEIQSSSYQNYVRTTIAMINKDTDSPGTFWVQQRGVNHGNKLALATYFRFSVEADVLPPESPLNRGFDQFDTSDITELNNAYKEAISIELLSTQKIESFDDPSIIKIGMYDGVRFGYSRVTDGKRTMVSRTIVVYEGKIYTITLAYRKDAGNPWIPVANRLLNSLILL